MIHQFHKFTGLINDGLPVAPGKNGSKESGDFNILFLAVTVRNADGVMRNERRPVIFFYLLIKKFFQLFVHGLKLGK